MIIDLGSLPSPEHKMDSDVLVIGGGTVGLLLATRLSENGKKVVVVESGGLTQEEDTHPFNRVVQLGSPYLGADIGRFRCLGGTSTRWGGSMLPFLPSDMEIKTPGWDGDWPIKPIELLKYRAEIEALFALPKGPYEDPERWKSCLPSNTFVPRLAKWPAFKLRNVATLFKNQIDKHIGLTVWLNATVTRFEFAANGRLATVTAQSCGGTKLNLRFKEAVIAAGAIESTRLLLLADHQNDQRIFAPDDILGRYFYDHVSARTARVRIKQVNALNRVVGFRFEGRGMRNLRFEPSHELRSSQSIPCGYAHIGFSTQAESAFDVLRDCYRKLQRGARPGSRELVALGSALPWLSRALWWRLFERRLLFPNRAQFDLHIVVEQKPLPSNRIGLSLKDFDRFGCPLATIDWRVGSEDLNNSLALTRYFISMWRKSALNNLADLEPMTGETVRETILNSGGIFHPGGSIRMSSNPRNGVVNEHLRTFRIPNLSVASTAVFPRGGGANPTMMLMMAALRLAKRLSAPES
jgi:choline dehydrogenase-like flavoprotein